MSSFKGAIIEYYDRISSDYEKLRKSNYHNYLNETEFQIIKNRIANKIVLDAGCGTGLILKRVRQSANVAIGVDISDKMLDIAQQKGLEVYNSSLDKLVFRDEYFDLVYSFKVLPHIQNFWPTINELSRITKQNGILVFEIYNKLSLRYLVNSFFVKEKVPYTRYDNPFNTYNSFKNDFFVEKVYGIRFLGINSQFYDFVLFQNFDSLLAGSFFKWFSGFLIFVLRKK